MTTIEPLKAMRIGCDSVVWVKLDSDDGTAAPIYSNTNGSENIMRLPGVMMLNINPNPSMETAFYDDGPGEVATTLGNIEVTFNKSALSPYERSVLLGKPMNNNSIVFLGKLDIPPWGALGFRTLKADGSYRYVWLLKGKFMDPVDDNETKADTINFQSDEIVGRFVKLNWEYTIPSYANGSTPVDMTVKPWKDEMDSTDYGGNMLQYLWFNSVVLPDSVLKPPIVTNPPIGYIFWSTDDGSQSYFIELNSNATITLDASNAVSSSLITSNYYLNNGAWTEDSTKAHNVINPTTMIIIYSTTIIKTSSLEVIANPKIMPGLPIAP